MFVSGLETWLVLGVYPISWLQRLVAACHDLALDIFLYQTSFGDKQRLLYQLSYTYATI